MKVICFIRFAIMMILAMFDNVVPAKRHTKKAGQSCSSDSDCVLGLICQSVNGYVSYCAQRSQCLIM